MSERLTPDNTIPVTARSADRLAELYGFPGIDELAADLPDSADVLDAGGGMSSFVQEIGIRRPDVRAVSVDACYDNSEVLGRLQAAAPANVEYVSGDLTRLETLFAPNSFHRVFSYWVLPHLSLYDRSPALHMARGLWNVQRLDEPISVGPQIGDITLAELPHLKQRLQAPAMRVVKNDSLMADEMVNHIVDAVQIPRRFKPGFIAWHEALSEVLDTNVHGRLDNNGERLIYDSDVDNYVLLSSSRGKQIRRTVARVALLHYPSAMRKASKQ